MVEQSWGGAGDASTEGFGWNSGGSTCLLHVVLVLEVTAEDSMQPLMC